MKYAVWTKIKRFLGYLEVHGELHGNAYVLNVCEMPSCRIPSSESVSTTVKRIVLTIEVDFCSTPRGCLRISPEPPPVKWFIVEDADVADLLKMRDFTPFRG